ncbi:FAD dependent oxidoreductase-domain-containing protein [Suillus fuscotomentosus]|uniref:FAD dependent oxidoreductase-domain-containing protein n=1 Tax=Suillus fuscotomentosus TaxID=1912939 RepID=A0AAD4EQB7_9AGAM|nr:FAD dependent oxidoreductase-domain-containing protein [Suillus fuscotomentosus]KAG1908688.1 FAD dependent oxidoreductase-domain-containing protein [Suillus fuscotomentosus]
MGNCVSRSKQPFPVFSSSSSAEKNMGNHISDGLPIAEPTTSFWTIPAAPISKPSSQKNLPSHADVVIIGSGISGASFARALLECGDCLHVVMLEAQDVCSGATGRNGGHIFPATYHDYEDLKTRVGEDMAKKMVRFRKAHLDEILAITAEESITEYTQCRAVEGVDVYFDKPTFKEAQRKLQVYQCDMGEYAGSYTCYEGLDAQERFHLSPLAVGCIATRAGAIHPYRFVTSILSRLLTDYPKEFEIHTHAPCTSIDEPTSSCPFYRLTTARGVITTPHVVHLTNAYAPALLPALKGVIRPIRETMTAQRPGRNLHASTLHGGRSFVFFDSPRKGFDYLTQLPEGEHELMFGAGFESRMDGGANAMYGVHSAAHVGGAMPIYFGAESWGAEALPTTPTDEEDVGVGLWAQGRVKAIWSGLLSESADGMPWVGNVPVNVAGRKAPPASSAPSALNASTRKLKSVLTAAPGEWIAAGYSGEGMVHAWLSSKAVALMLLGEDLTEVKTWLPELFSVTEDRVKMAKRTFKPDVVLSGKKRVFSP